MIEGAEMRRDAFGEGICPCDGVLSGISRGWALLVQNAASSEKAFL